MFGIDCGNNKDFIEENIFYPNTYRGLNTSEGECQTVHNLATSQHKISSKSAIFLKKMAHKNYGQAYKEHKLQ